MFVCGAHSRVQPTSSQPPHLPCPLSDSSSLPSPPLAPRAVLHISAQGRPARERDIEHQFDRSVFPRVSSLKTDTNTHIQTHTHTHTEQLFSVVSGKASEGTHKLGPGAPASASAVRHARMSHCHRLAPESGEPLKGDGDGGRGMGGFWGGVGGESWSLWLKGICHYVDPIQVSVGILFIFYFFLC